MSLQTPVPKKDSIKNTLSATIAADTPSLKQKVIVAYSGGKGIKPTKITQADKENKLSTANALTYEKRVQMDKNMWNSWYNSSNLSKFESLMFHDIDKKTDALLTKYSVRAGARAFALLFKDLFFEAFESDIQDIGSSPKLLAKLNALFNSSPAKNIPEAERIKYFNSIFAPYSNLLNHYSLLDLDNVLSK